MSHVSLAASAILAATLVLPACAEPRDELDEAALERVGEYHGLAQLNARPYASTVAPATISVWFGGGAIGDYLRIRPDTTGSGAVLAPGALIVREVLNRDGSAVDKLTVMCKGPAGYDPTLGDWWFAVTDPAGTPLEDERGPMVGRLAGCHDCHVDRAADDFLFGIPLGVTPPRS